MAVIIKEETINKSVRYWINYQIAKISPLFTGDVINVSGGTDMDKQKNFYADYFSNAKSYTISNSKPGSINGYQGRKNEILLDLTKPLPEKYTLKYDVVFSYSVIDCILPVTDAFKNTCFLSRDILIIAVPFIRQLSSCKDYKDYWRFTSSCIEDLCKANGLTLLKWMESPNIKCVMLLCVASRHPEKWEEIQKLLQ